MYRIPCSINEYMVSYNISFCLYNVQTQQNYDAEMHTNVGKLKKNRKALW